MIIYFFVNLKSIFYFKSLTKLPSKFIPVVPGLFSTFSPSASLSSSCSPYRHYLSHFSSLKIYLKYFHCGKLHHYHCISAMPFHASILARLSHRYCLLTKSSPPSLPSSHMLMAVLLLGILISQKPHLLPLLLFQPKLIRFHRIE